jgi:hypothetical protein
MKVVPRELMMSLFVLPGMKGVFICPLSDRTGVIHHIPTQKALKGRVAFPGCIQRAGAWWKARMSTKREKDPEAARRNRLLRK